MTKKEKDRYRKILENKKKEIIDHMSEYNHESREIETGIAQDVGDKAESSYTKEFLLSLSSAERAQLGLIDRGLKRLDTPDFGLCEECGKSIQKKRMDILPWTPHCISCQKKKENGW